jgi:hypothetical protein
MRPITQALLAAVLAMPLMACHFGDSDDGKPGIPGTGTGNARSYPVSDFNSVTLAGSDNIDVRVGTAYSVRAEGPGELLEKLRVRKDGDKLTIDRRGNSWGGGDRSLRIFVTLPRLTAATIAGSGDMGVDRVAGSGTLRIAGGTVDSLVLTTAGSGDISAAGTAKSLKLLGAGSGDIDAAKVAATTADVSMAGSGNVTAVVNGPATVNIMGSGDVDLGPGARCTTHKMGSGEVRCGG